MPILLIFMFPSVVLDRLLTTFYTFHGVGWRQPNRALSPGFRQPTTDFMESVMCLACPQYAVFVLSYIKLCRDEGTFILSFAMEL